MSRGHLCFLTLRTGHPSSSYFEYWDLFIFHSPFLPNILILSLLSLTQEGKKISSPLFYIPRCALPVIFNITLKFLSVRRDATLLIKLWFLFGNEHLLQSYSGIDKTQAVCQTWQAPLLRSPSIERTGTLFQFGGRCYFYPGASAPNIYTPVTFLV